MPKRTDITSILIIGAGPIVIGQACEFDYSGVQACKALRAEGYRIVLVNSNPATIMTDPDAGGRHLYRADHAGDGGKDHRSTSGRTRCFPTMGGQTALNTALALEKSRAFSPAYGVEMIGAKADVIEKAEDRQKFRDAMDQARPGKPTLPRLPIATGRSSGRPSTTSACQPSSGQASPWPAPAAASPTITEEFKRDRRAGTGRLACERGADRRERARLEGVRDGGGPRPWRTTASSSARSKTSIRWGSTPATASPSRRR